MLPEEGGAPATLENALWLADVAAFDHDAPVGVRPSFAGPGKATDPRAAVPPRQPISPVVGDAATWYWADVGAALDAAARLRFNDSYAIRYGDDGDPGTDFSDRFRGREDRLALYAMAARQADVLIEYMCLYRVLEAADGKNGKKFAAERLADIDSHDFGVLHVVSPTTDDGEHRWTDAFACYRDQAREELARMKDLGVGDVPGHLYRFRNSVAHGKHDVLVGSVGRGLDGVVRALPVVKLLARMAVEGRLPHCRSGTPSPSSDDDSTLVLSPTQEIAS